MRSMPPSSATRRLSPSSPARSRSFRATRTLPELARRYSSEPAGLVAIVDSAGVDLTGDNVLSRDPGFRKALDAARLGTASTGEVNGIVYVAVPVSVGGGAVLVARSDEPIDHRVHQFWLVLVGLGVSVLGVSLAISSRLSRWVVDPLRRLDQQAAALGQGQMSARADTAHGPPEVVALADTFNEMADRLDELVTSQRRFVADASHQLRTPLTALRLRLETLGPESAATRDAALDEVARLTRLVDGLLSLARAEGARPVREPVSVTAVLAERHEAWLPLATEQRVGLDLDMSGSASVTAQLVPGHLEQILDNLIDNALDVSPPDSTVILRSARVGGYVEIHVIDEGPGMTEEERRDAFAPFWQSATGRRAGSSGLGLAIAQQLARGESRFAPSRPFASRRHRRRRPLQSRRGREGSSVFRGRCHGGGIAHLRWPRRIGAEAGGWASPRTKDTCCLLWP